MSYDTSWNAVKWNLNCCQSVLFLKSFSLSNTCVVGNRTVSQKSSTFSEQYFTADWGNPAWLTHKILLAMTFDKLLNTELKNGATEFTTRSLLLCKIQLSNHRMVHNSLYNRKRNCAHQSCHYCETTENAITLLPRFHALCTPGFPCSARRSQGS